jgi:hypothetical protein
LKQALIDAVARDECRRVSSELGVD